MGTSTIVAIVVVVLLAGAALLALPMLRRRRLRGRFGPEYDRAVEQHGSRAEAERELRDRERRHAELELRPLSAAAKAAYTQRWNEVQARFVDEPRLAVHDADQLVGELMAERGYPATDHDERAALLSVEHSQTMDAYRAANDTRQRAGTDGTGQASTEHLREAMVQYRTLFTELMGTDDDGDLDDRADHRADDRADGGVDRHADHRLDDRVDERDPRSDATTEAAMTDRHETDEARADRPRHASR